MTAAYDSKGNLTTDPVTAKTFTYSNENLLKTASGGVSLSYDPLLRLQTLTGAATTNFAYDGLDLIGFGGRCSWVREASVVASPHRFRFRSVCGEPV